MSNREKGKSSKISPLIETGKLWTDHDLDFLRKSTNDSSQNGNSTTQSSLKGIKFSNPTHVKVKKPTIQKKEGGETILEDSLFFVEHEEGQLGRLGLNKWMMENIIRQNYNSPAILNYFRTKEVDPWTTKIILSMVDKVVKTAVIHSGLEVKELSREDLISPEVFSTVPTLISSKVEYDYFFEFINKLSPFSKVQKPVWTSFKSEQLNHPMVNYAGRVLMKTHKKRSLESNLYSPIKKHFQWLCNSLNDFKGLSINDIIVFSITEDHLEEFRMYLIIQVRNEQITEGYAHQLLLYIKRFYKLLYKHNKIPKDISTNIQNVSTIQWKKRELLSNAEFKSFFQAVHKYSDNPKKERLAFSLLVCLALRGIDVGNLRWDCINLSTDTISIVNSKYTDAILPIPREIKKQFLEIDEKRDGYVFCDDDYPTPQLFKRRLYENFKLYALVSGLDKYEGGLHIFRHAAVTRLAKLNLAPSLLKEFGRMKSDHTLAHYLHLEQSYLLNEMKKFNK